MPDDLARYESATERAIRTAIEAGEFDDLPGAGRPIPDLQTPYDPAWWARRFVARERARDAAHDIAASTFRRIPSILASDEEAAARRGLEQLNEEITTLNATLPGEDHIPVLEVEDLLALRRRRRTQSSG